MVHENIDNIFGINESNIAFYDFIKPEGLKKFTIKAGLATDCDMSVLKPYWFNAISILEIGAGYGRAIDYLLKHQFQGEIVAVERRANFFKHLTKLYHANENVSLIYSNWQKIPASI